MDAFQIKAVNHVLHRNVAGKIPVLDIHCRIPLTVPLWKHMEKNTVQQAVQIGPRHPHPSRLGKKEKLGKKGKGHPACALRYRIWLTT